MHGCKWPIIWTRTRTVRLKIIGNLETMHDSDLPTFFRISLPIIFKRTVYCGELSGLRMVVAGEKCGGGAPGRSVAVPAARACGHVAHSAATGSVRDLRGPPRTRESSHGRWQGIWSSPLERHRHPPPLQQARDNRQKAAAARPEDHACTRHSGCTPRRNNDQQSVS